MTKVKTSINTIRNNDYAILVEKVISESTYDIHDFSEPKTYLEVYAAGSKEKMEEAIRELSLKGQNYILVQPKEVNVQVGVSIQ